jgi:pyridoxal phosphate enzyme (YggS family)
MGTIGANLQAVHERIARAATACGRRPQDVALIAVSKRCSADAVAAAYAHGQRAFGESYVQEALAKIAGFQAMPSGLQTATNALEPESTASGGRGPLEWHFIGPIQSNKTKLIAENFDWVHSVDRLNIAERLSAARPAALAPLQVCLQVNIGSEATKSGVAAREAPALAHAVLSLPGISLRGLMTIPPATSDPLLQRRYFAELRLLKEESVAGGIPLDTLSMGMSEDLEAAIAEGATLVRVGTAIFGERAPR